MLRLPEGFATFENIFVSLLAHYLAKANSVSHEVIACNR